MQPTHLYWIVLSFASTVILTFSSTITTQLVPLFALLDHIPMIVVGAPVIVDGLVLGTVCILDTKPREEFSAQNTELLEHLAQLVVHQILAHKAIKQCSVIYILTRLCLSGNKNSGERPWCLARTH